MRSKLFSESYSIYKMFECLSISKSKKDDVLVNFNKVLLIFLSTLSVSAIASTQGEINHLLSFVAATDCKYERNGTMHTGAEAVEHINKKYDYYSDDITSTEDFIEYSATQSKMSGKYYKIHCKGTPVIKSQDWLFTELQAYRAAQQ